MKTIIRLVEEMKAKWGRRAQHRRSLAGATAAAYRMAFNGCR